MEILKIIETLQSYTEDVVAYKLDRPFAHAVSEAVSMLVAQGERIAELEDQNRWVPVTEPPKEKECYFVTVKHWFDGNPVTREAYWNGADWLSCERRHEITPRVTHWKPLPEPQKGD